MNTKHYLNKQLYLDYHGNNKCCFRPGLGKPLKMENDEIMDEWDVFITTELTPFLHLIPLPSTTLSSRFNSPSSQNNSSRFKSQAKRLELVLPFNDLSKDNLINERIKELQMEKGQKLMGAGWQWRRAQYLLGQFSSNL